MNPIHLSDGYKVDHRSQYPTDTELVYSNLTPRKSRLDGFDTVVFFGMQYFIKKYLMEEFNEQFFQKPKAEVLRKYQRRIENYLGKGASYRSPTRLGLLTTGNSGLTRRNTYAFPDSDVYDSEYEA